MLNRGRCMEAAAAPEIVDHMPGEVSNVLQGRIGLHKGHLRDPFLNQVLLTSSNSVAH